MTRERAPQRVLITGTSRGLGLEFVRQYAESGDRVFALAREPLRSKRLMELAARNPERVFPVACDVADESLVNGARQEVELATDALDLVINNAAIYGPREETLASLDWEEVKRVFEVNTLGPIRVSRAFLPLLRRGERPRLVHITSMMGSVEDNREGGHWSYRLSKSALHMANRNLALEWERWKIPCVVISPGWVRTDMGGMGAPLSPEESVASMVKTIDSLIPRHSGKIFQRDGQPGIW
jgi:NAD(P)-dependent dehydrogenase (short-subunit alcohol dehydrogenase family)